MSTRFDYVKYDQAAHDFQTEAKRIAMLMERLILKIRRDIKQYGSTQAPQNPKLGHRGQKYTDRAMDALEVTYAMVGKAIRDLQILRNGSAPLQEERSGE